MGAAHGVRDAGRCTGVNVRHLRTLAALALGCALGACGSAAPRSTIGRSGTGAAPAGLRLAPARLAVAAANARGPFATARSLMIPRGWRIETWALVPNARFMAWTPQSTLLVSDPYDGTVVELTPAPNPAAAPSARVLIANLTMPQGLAFDTVGGQIVLYVAQSDEIDRYVWSGPAVLGARTVIARGLPDTDARGDDVHRLKTLVIGADHRIDVGIGSADNASAADIAGEPPRASVVSYPPSGGAPSVLARGVRNAEGLAVAPDGSLWAAVNERDEMPYPFHGAYGSTANAYGRVIRAYVNEHPPDEIARLTPGRDLGWPYCDPDPARGDANLGWDEDPQTNAGGSVLDCAKLAPLERGLPAHSAPLGFHFLDGSALPSSLTAGAVLAVHGSWDRQPPRAPAVLWLPWSGAAHTLGAPVMLVGGFQAPGGGRFGRPVDAVPGPDGSLYISDDTAGAIYRLTPP